MITVSTMFYAGFVKRIGEVETRRGQEIRTSEDQDIRELRNQQNRRRVI
ncbi:hypothetical protein ES705_15720 [subsurface metagenome]